jgi:hypothetical protein
LLSFSRPSRHIHRWLQHHSPVLTSADYNTLLQLTAISSRGSKPKWDRQHYIEQKCYECAFTSDYPNRTTIEKSNCVNIFNRDVATAFLINRTLEWRIEDIFDAMIEENSMMRPYKNEMVQNLISEIVLFAQRLIPVELEF